METPLRLKTLGNETVCQNFLINDPDASYDTHDAA